MYNSLIDEAHKMYIFAQVSWWTVEWQVSSNTNNVILVFLLELKLGKSINCRRWSEDGSARPRFQPSMTLATQTTYRRCHRKQRF